MTRAYLSLGSNLGDRLANIVAAVRALKETHRVVALSPIYETAPLGPDGAIVRDQASYLNCVVAIETEETAVQLRTRTSAIETAMGRRAGERWRPRPIDIDIVMFGDERIDSASLVVPHPRLHERGFVVQPLLDLDPAIVVPGVGALAPLRRGLLWQDVHESVSVEEFAERIARREK